MRQRRLPRQDEEEGREGPVGFTLVELAVAMGITLLVCASIFQLLAQASRGVSRELGAPEGTQRLRAAADALQRDLLLAGASLNEAAGPDVGWVAPIRPAASGPWHADGERAYATDRISLAFRDLSAEGGGVVRRVYHHDAPGRRLMLYDGVASDQPVVDSVDFVGFAYFVDPDPATIPPPPAGTANCVFAAGEPPVPRLLTYGGAVLRQAGAAELTDDPACGSAPDRFDGDLLRIRMVRVTLGIGSPQGGAAERVTFDVAPRNMNLTR
jgi:hypothetical protein